MSSPTDTSLRDVMDYDVDEVYDYVDESSELDSESEDQSMDDNDEDDGDESNDDDDDEAMPASAAPVPAMAIPARVPSLGVDMAAHRVEQYDDDSSMVDDEPETTQSDQTSPLVNMPMSVKPKPKPKKPKAQPTAVVAREVVPAVVLKTKPSARGPVTIRDVNVPGVMLNQGKINNIVHTYMGKLAREKPQKLIQMARDTVIARKQNQGLTVNKDSIPRIAKDRKPAQLSAAETRRKEWVDKARKGSSLSMEEMTPFYEFAHEALDTIKSARQTRPASRLDLQSIGSYIEGCIQIAFKASQALTLLFKKQLTGGQGFGRSLMSRENHLPNLVSLPDVKWQAWIADPSNEHAVKLLREGIDGLDGSVTLESIFMDREVTPRSIMHRFAKYMEQSTSVMEGLKQGKKTAAEKTAVAKQERFQWSQAWIQVAAMFGILDLAVMALKGAAIEFGEGSDEEESKAPSHSEIQSFLLPVTFDHQAPPRNDVTIWTDPPVEPQSGSVPERLTTSELIKQLFWLHGRSMYQLTDEKAETRARTLILQWSRRLPETDDKPSYRPPVFPSTKKSHKKGTKRTATAAADSEVVAELPVTKARSKAESKKESLTGTPKKPRASKRTRVSTLDVVKSAQLRPEQLDALQFHLLSLCIHGNQIHRRIQDI